jgi:hypothetical protein
MYDDCLLKQHSLQQMKWLLRITKKLDSSFLQSDCDDKIECILQARNL